MASPTAGDVLIETLIDWGVDTIFGFPGDGINGIFEALRTQQGQDPLHPGAPRGSRGLHGLRLCQVHRPAGRLHRHLRARRHSSAQRPLRRQVDGAARAGHHRPYTSTTSSAPSPSRTWTSTSCSWTSPTTTSAIMGPAHVDNVVDHACRTALAYAASPTSPSRTISRSVPIKTGARSRRNVPHHISRCAGAFERALPARIDLRARRRHPQRGKKIAILAGRGASAPAASCEQLAEKLGAPIVKPLLGKAAVPDDSPYTTGGIGLLGTEPVAGRDEELRHAVHRRQLVSLHRVLSQARPGASACRSTSIRSASACAIRSTSASSAMPARACARSCRCCKTHEDRASSRKRRTA